LGVNVALEDARSLLGSLIRVNWDLALTRTGLVVVVRDSLAGWLVSVDTVRHIRLFFDVCEKKGSSVDALLDYLLIDVELEHNTGDALYVHADFSSAS
jgi:hypothetical protein